MIDLNTFKRDSDFYGNIDLTLSVKSFNLQEIRARYLASKKIGKKVGSFKRRAVAEGGIISTSIFKGEIKNEKILVKVKEPRGIGASKNGSFAFSSENMVYVIHEDIKIIKDSWFSYIHTVDFNTNNDKLLISSSGFDMLLEYDINTLKKTYEWLAWENGFNKTIDPATGKELVLSRTKLDNTSIKTKIISNPLTDALPTAMRAAFINSAHYNTTNNDSILATFFHEGKLFNINKTTGEASSIIKDLKNPHGGKNYKDGVFITSTATGEVITKTNQEITKYNFSNLPNKPIELAQEEWLQNSLYLNDIIITIDSNRTSFVIFNPKEKLIDIIPYNNNWAIQDLIAFDVSDALASKIASISE